MPKKTTQSINPAHAEAEDILRSLREAVADARMFESEYARAMEAVKQNFADRIANVKDAVAYLESKLEMFAKNNKSVLFAQADTRLELQNGALIYTIEKRVKRIRDMLARLEESRRHELIKIAKSVDWDSVEKLSDAELAALGTRRQSKEHFAYEIKP